MSARSHSVIGLLLLAY